MDANQAELDSYNASYGARQNTGKPEPRRSSSGVRRLMGLMSGRRIRVAKRSTDKARTLLCAYIRLVRID